MYRYVANRCNAFVDGFGLAGCACEFHTFYGDQAEIWDMMYKQGLLKAPKPEGETYPNPPSDAWNVPENTWVDGYFCWEKQYFDNVDYKKLIRRSEKELGKNTREEIHSIKTIRESSVHNIMKSVELCKKGTCDSVTVHMHCGKEFLDAIKVNTVPKNEYEKECSTKNKNDCVLIPPKKTIGVSVQYEIDRILKKNIPAFEKQHLIDEEILLAKSITEDYCKRPKSYPCKQLMKRGNFRK
jgi:hypothetical protein